MPITNRIRRMSRAIDIGTAHRLLPEDNLLQDPKERKLAEIANKAVLDWYTYLNNEL